MTETPSAGTLPAFVERRINELLEAERHSNSAVTNAACQSLRKAIKTYAENEAHMQKEKLETACRKLAEELKQANLALVQERDAANRHTSSRVKKGS